MRNLFFQCVCLALGITWTIAGDSASASSWLAASVVISRIGKVEK